jgi:hypothetical protein
LGRIAVTYFEWSSPGRNTMIVPWMVVDSAESAAAFAEMLHGAPLVNSQATSISGALLFSATLLDRSMFTAPRRVVDVSGDGPNNMGLPIMTAREMALEAGVVINGLPISIARGDLLFELTGISIATYYEQCVIGGEGAFLVSVDDVADLADAIRKKIVMEIAYNPMEDLRPRLVQARPGVDCSVAEN